MPLRANLEVVRCSSLCGIAALLFSKIQRSPDRPMPRESQITASAASAGETHDSAMKRPTDWRPSSGCPLHHDEASAQRHSGVRDESAFDEELVPDDSDTVLPLQPTSFDSTARPSGSSEARPAGESAADIDAIGGECEAAMLTKLLEGVRASDPPSGGRYEIVTVTVAGQQTGAIRWRPTGAKVPSGDDTGQMAGQASRAPRRHPRKDGDRPSPLPDTDALTTVHPNSDSRKFHVPRPPIPAPSPCGGGNSPEVSSTDRGPPPKRRRRKATSSKAEHRSAVKKRQAWSATWREHEAQGGEGGTKDKRKYFYIKNHGFDGAKVLAEGHRRETERTGRAVLPKRLEHQGGVKGVYYNRAYNHWVDRWHQGGRSRAKCFSVRELGMEGAKQAAIAHSHSRQ
ncbi:unnamed protein product [Vitrella brassicaformis CCMP3155]|uniref:Uncharacterized protein n=1 Tax=Vitrella brassicaformis (strain CCMP3155) TaxID=1169540 RepID=A0A0G4G2N9_VITBC|nr:unnamed protein product [Vitrella brassicaformis CCMP3155]|eukprot:CEM22534.1 unnamed protein product [Vitrella brassicaformis CCMP3155]